MTLTAHTWCSSHCFVVSSGLILVTFIIDLIHEHVIVRLRHSLLDGKLQKEERALCFTAGLL